MDAPIENKNQTFFNVMPEASMAGPLVNSAPVPGAVQTTKKITIPGGGFNKKLLAIPVVLVLIALLGAGVWFFVFNKTEEETPIVTPEPIVKEEPKTNEEVTTPGDWLAKYFESETCTEINICGDKADPDRDGLNNKEEYDFATDPNNEDSDAEGIADGDEKNIFGTDPLLSRTYRDGDYNDADFIKGGYDIATNQAFTPDKLSSIKAAIQEKGLHQPTISTMGETAFTIYGFSDPNAPLNPLPNLEQTPEAKLDRDTQRQSTIKKIGVALVKYKNANKTYPGVTDFVKMSDMVSSFNTVATNYNDPINVNQYVYGYQPMADNKDFVLTYFSETQNQLIKYKASDAEAEAVKEINQASDDQRKIDLESIKSALMVYSNTQLDPNSDRIYIFPPVDQYQTALAKYFTAGVPVDPITKQNYTYEVGEQMDTFVIRAVLQNPTAGTTGYMCNQEECRNY